jgi:hypothetical protein
MTKRQALIKLRTDRQFRICPYDLVYKKNPIMEFIPIQPYSPHESDK